MQLLKFFLPLFILFSCKTAFHSEKLQAQEPGIHFIEDDWNNALQVAIFMQPGADRVNCLNNILLPTLL